MEPIKIRDGVRSVIQSDSQLPMIIESSLEPMGALIPATQRFLIVSWRKGRPRLTTEYASDKKEIPATILFEVAANILDRFILLRQVCGGVCWYSNGQLHHRRVQLGASQDPTKTTKPQKSGMLHIL